ncbi:MAG: hypothetical protein ACPG4Z_05305 [Chitinophagales bacterium]
MLGEKSDEELSKDVLQYLESNYEGEFEMTYSHWICNEGNLTSGCPSYELAFINKENPNRAFYVLVSYENDTMKVIQDDYQDLLISLYAEKQVNKFLSAKHQNRIAGVEVSYLYPESELNKDSIALFMKKEVAHQSYSRVSIAIIDTLTNETELMYDSLVWTTILHLDSMYANSGILEVHFYNDSIEGTIQDLKPFIFTGNPPQQEKITHIWYLQFDMDYFEQYNVSLTPKTIDSLTSKRESYYN